MGEYRGLDTMTMGLLALAVLLVALPSYRARRARLRSQGIASGD